MAGLAESGGQTWWESFSEEFWFYTVSVAAVLALSPLIAIVALADTGSWVLLPLLLVPLLAVQKAAEMSREKEHQALHDPLTGLPNRLLLNDRIDQALARSARQSGRVAVLFLDLDLFKVVNDSLGHAAGDQLLIEVSRRLAGVVRPGDTLSRFGGDEFVIVCDNMPDTEVEGLARRAASAVRETFQYHGQTVNVSASIGIAMASAETDSDALLRDADAALYRAKAGGRNQAIVFDAVMHEQATLRLEAESGLRAAVKDGQLRVVYQPVIDVTDRHRHTASRHSSAGTTPLAVCSAPTTSSRWQRRQDSSWRWATGCWRRQWSRRGGGGTRSRGAATCGSRSTSRRGSCARRASSETLSQVLASTGLPPEAACLEITESALMDEAGPHLAAMRDIRSLGVHLAVDDFGTGYSSLAYLKTLPVSIIKIDRSFIAGLGGPDLTAPAIVAAIVGMASALRLRVIAEGVETQEQLDELRRLGVGLGQGFYWARPMPAGGRARVARDPSGPVQ